VTSRKIVSFGDRLALGWHIFSAPIVWETANVVSRARAVKRLLHALIEIGGLAIGCGRQ
jgi:hypothetical protein